MGEWERELELAVRAVRAASRACRAIRSELVAADTLEKKDRSPVTVADFASQAIVCGRLENAFPGDPVVAEENARELRRREMEPLRRSVVRHVAAELGPGAVTDRVLEWIDRGSAAAVGPRYWTLDPIDGTKGFLRGGQYAVALALIEDGEVVLGVLGCPNLPGPQGERGALFAAVRGAGTRILPLWDDAAGGGEPVSVTAITSAADARFCESLEAEHSDHEGSARVARMLGITAAPYRLDSQCKYATVARGETSVYMRIPRRAGYREKIWDHAAGKIIVEEAGGKVTDIDGRPLDFRHGRTLDRNRGILATCGSIHDEVLDAILRVGG